LKQRIVIFGAGQAGVAAKKNLQSEFFIMAFCDNDARKVGSTLDGLPVIAVEALNNDDYDFIMIASEYFEQIYTQLKQREGIAVDKIKVLQAQHIKRFHFGHSDNVKQSSERLLLALCEALTSCKIKYYIDAGTLLGVYRDDGFIPWDDDFDFAVLSQDITTIKHHQGELLAALEQASKQPWQMTEYFAQQSFGLVDAGATRSFKLAPVNTASQLPLIDLFVKYVDQEKMDYVIASRGFSMPSAHMRQVVPFTFRGQSIFIPSDVEGYLSRHYGDWQTPKSDWTLDDVKSSTIFE
jgi:hypothetical protein